MDTLNFISRSGRFCNLFFRWFRGYRWWLLSITKSIDVFNVFAKPTMSNTLKNI